MPDERDAPRSVEEHRAQLGRELEVEAAVRVEPGVQKDLERSIEDMALSPVAGVDGLYVGGLWALRRSDSLLQRGVTHVLSLVSIDLAQLKNFKGEPFSEYSKPFKHLLVELDDVEDEDILIHLPRAVSFIDDALAGGDTDTSPPKGAIFVHCAAGKSRSVSMVVAYLLWKYPNLLAATTAESASDSVPVSAPGPRREAASRAVDAAVELIRRTRPMAEPNEGFMQQLALWWEWHCPMDMEAHPAYQRWAYQREVRESVHLGMAPSRLRFEDEVARSADDASSPAGRTNLRCKKCRRTLATGPFVLQHSTPTQAPPTTPTASCQHVFIEPLSWMRAELERGELSGRLSCPNARCGAGVGRYDWKGFPCTCGAWLTPAFSLQKAKVDEQLSRPAASTPGMAASLGIRMPPGFPRGGGNL